MTVYVTATFLNNKKGILCQIFPKALIVFLCLQEDVRGRFLVISKKFFEFFIESVFFIYLCGKIIR